jgi:hypothetical protein
MSDFNRDPYNPPPGGPYDQYGNSRFEPGDSGRGPYILLAILVAIGVIGGLLYFNHKPVDQQAQAPVTKEQTTPTPLGSPGGPNSTPGRAPGGPAGAGMANPTPAPSGTSR